jgi:hypothetical protein
MKRTALALTFILALLLSALAGTMHFVTVQAESSITKPSVPEFTVKLVSHPYNVAETTQIDPYTGTVHTYPGYVEENRSIEITIKTQPFSSYQMADGNWSRLYYNLRFKGHFYAGDWTYYPLSPESGYINASLSDYTVISLPKWLLSGNLPAGSQLDFQAQALIGYDEAKYAKGAENHIIFVGNNFTGEASNWSNTQTLTIPTSTSSPTSSPSVSPSPSPSLSSFPEPTPEVEPFPTTLVTVVMVSVVIIGIGLLVYFKKRKNARINKHSEIEQPST